jgi:peptidoglycan/xylan/chitin deacetylase (PgdA/CDA1 family)
MRAVGIPILMYHRVSPQASAAMRRFTVDPANFEAQLSYLREHGFHGITVAQFHNLRGRGVRSWPDRPVILTFDDGYRDFADFAVPLLQKYDFPASLYVVSGLVGATSRWLPGEDSHLPLLDWADLARLPALGIEIGSHSMTHRALDALPDKELLLELSESKGIIEQKLSLEVVSLAYPFGFRSNRVKKTAEESGYAAACAVRYALSSFEDNSYDLARYIVPGDMSLAGFALIVGGEHVVLTQLPLRLRSKAWDWTRHGAHYLGMGI